MSRSNTIFATLLAGFVIFVTLRGELRGYLQVLGLV